MNIMLIVATGVLLSLIVLIWISLKNSRLLKELMSAGAVSKDVVTALQQEASSVLQDTVPVVEFADIEQCIRKEGFVPVRKDNFISFKISSEEVDVFYNDEKLSLVRTYGLDDEVNFDVLSQACSLLHDSTFLIRSSLHKYDNDQMGLVFEVQAMVTSPVELDRYFSRYLNLLYHGIERHREIYGKLMEEKATKAKGVLPPQVHDQKVVS